MLTGCESKLLFTIIYLLLFAIFVVVLFGFDVVSDAELAAGVESGVVAAWENATNKIKTTPK